MPVSIDYKTLQVTAVYATEEQFRKKEKFEVLQHTVLDSTANERYITNIKFERFDFEELDEVYYLYLIYHANVASLNGCVTIADIENMLDSFLS